MLSRDIICAGEWGSSSARQLACNLQLPIAGAGTSVRSSVVDLSLNHTIKAAGFAHNVRSVLLRRPTRLHDGSCTGNVNASKRSFAPSKMVKNNGREAGAEKRKHWSRPF